MIAVTCDVSESLSSETPRKGWACGMCALIMTAAALAI